MIDNTRARRNAQRTRSLELGARGLCADEGPWGAVCTDRRMHDYAHYDSSEDTSWTDHYEDWPDRLDAHPLDCPCGGGHAWDRR